MSRTSAAEVSIQALSPADWAFCTACCSAAICAWVAGCEAEADGVVAWAKAKAGIPTKRGKSNRDLRWDILICSGETSLAKGVREARGAKRPRDAVVVGGSREPWIILDWRF